MKALISSRCAWFTMEFKWYWLSPEFSDPCPNPVECVVIGQGGARPYCRLHAERITAGFPDKIELYIPELYQ